VQRSFEGSDSRTSAFGPDSVDLVARIGQLARIIPDRQLARLLNRLAWSRAKATKALGLEMPAMLLGNADDVIE
jgi:hypothetical protein